MKITINEKTDRSGKSVFIGNVNHKTGALTFRQIKGEKRSLEKQTYFPHFTNNFHKIGLGLP